MGTWHRQPHQVLGSFGTLKGIERTFTLQVQKGRDLIIPECQPQRDLSQSDQPHMTNEETETRSGRGFVQAHTASQGQSWGESPDILTAGSAPLPPGPHCCRSTSLLLQPSAFEDVGNRQMGADRKSPGAFYWAKALSYRWGRWATH